MTQSFGEGPRPVMYSKRNRGSASGGGGWANRHSFFSTGRSEAPKNWGGKRSRQKGASSRRMDFGDGRQVVRKSWRCSKIEPQGAAPARGVFLKTEEGGGGGGEEGQFLAAVGGLGSVLSVCGKWLGVSPVRDPKLLYVSRDVEKDVGGEESIYIKEVGDGKEMRRMGKSCATDRTIEVGKKDLFVKRGIDTEKKTFPCSTARGRAPGKKSTRRAKKQQPKNR